MKRIVDQYQIGMIADTHQRKDLAEIMKMALFDEEKISIWKQNLPKAARELCWENEEIILRRIYFPYL